MVTATSGAVYDLVQHGTTTPILANTTVTFTTAGCVQPPPPSGTVTVANTAIDPTVACGTIRVSWSAVSGATTYYIYRNQSNTTPVPGVTSPIGNTAGTVYVDATTTDSGGDYYWVAAYNSTFGGYSTPTLATPVPISNTPCQANLSTSQNIYTQLQPGGVGAFIPFASVTTIRTGDVVTAQIQVTNTGTLAAQNVSAVEIPVNLANPTAFKLNGVTWSVTAPSSGSYTLPTIASIAAGTTTTITFNAIVTQPSGGGTGLYRFSNSLGIAFTTTAASNNAGCISTGTDSLHPCTVVSGSYPFYNGSSNPVQHEVAP